MNKYVLSLDVGERRIGVALASNIARLPAPLMTIDRNKEPDVFKLIAQVVEKEQVEVVIVGLPRGLEGQETTQTVASRIFASKLGESLSIPIVMQDEAGTSVEAERVLKQRGKPYEKSDIDAEAAVIILRDYLHEKMDNSV